MLGAFAIPFSRIKPHHFLKSWSQGFFLCELHTNQPPGVVYLCPLDRKPIGLVITVLLGALLAVIQSHIYLLIQVSSCKRSKDTECIQKLLQPLNTAVISSCAISVFIFLPFLFHFSSNSLLLQFVKEPVLQKAGKFYIRRDDSAAQVV